MKTKNGFLHILTRENGQGLTEYLLLLFLVSVICITAVQKLGTTVRTNLDQADRTISRALTTTDHANEPESRRSNPGFNVGGINIGDIFGGQRR